MALKARGFLITAVFILFCWLNASCFINDWLVAGPFKFHRNTDPVKTPFIENTKGAVFQENKEIEGRKVIKYISRTNFIDLQRVYPDENLDRAVCYAVTNLYCDTPMKDTRIFIGSDDMIVVYLNGEPVHVFNKGRRSVLPQVDCVEGVELRQGWNQLAVKIINIAGKCSFFVHLADKKDIPLKNCAVSLYSKGTYGMNIKKINDSLAKGVDKGTNVMDWYSILHKVPTRIMMTNPEKVTLSFDRNSIINDDFRGVGVQGDLFLWARNKKGITEEDRNMISGRVMKLNPSIVRLFLAAGWWNPGENKYDWENQDMQNLYRTLDLYRSMGTEVILDVRKLPQWMGPASNKKNIKILAGSVAKLAEYLIKTGKYENVKYLTVCDEPGAGRCRLFADYKTLYEYLDTELKEKNIRGQISLTGPGELDSYEWFEETADRMDSIIDVYDSHNYAGEGSLENLLWAKDRAGKLSGNNKVKPWLITEFGRNYPWLDPFYYGRFVADFAIITVNAGASGLILWEMQSNYFPGEKGCDDRGLWEYKDKNWAVRPVYYAYSLLTNNFRKGIRVLESKTSSTEILSLAAENRRGKVLFLVSNRSNAANIEISGDFGNSRKFNKYTYNGQVMNRKDDNIILPEPVELNSEGKLADRIAQKSFILYVQK